MSSFSNIIRLFPTTTDNHTETLEPDVTFPCPYCSGNGWHWNYSERETVKAICKNCNGSGRLKAKVTIHWGPAGPPIPIFHEEGEV